MSSARTMRRDQREHGATTVLSDGDETRGQGVMMGHNGDRRSLKDFALHARFGLGSLAAVAKDDRVAAFEQALEASLSGDPRLVIVHSPYPEARQREALRKAEDLPYSLSGKGVGKTAMLRACVEVARAVDQCEVFDFLNNRKRLTGSERFFEDILVARLLQHRRSWSSVPALFHLWSLYHRLGMLVRVATRMVGAFIAWLLSILGLEILEYFYDPSVRSGVNKLIDVLIDYGGLLWIVVGFVLIVVCWLRFQGELDANSKEKAIYRALAPTYLRERYEQTRRERLLSRPENLLSFLPSGKCQVWVIDDVDCFDSRSVDSILDLHQAARDSNGKCRVCIVLGYNPRNPTLWFPERERTRQSLSEDSIARNASWVPLCITPLHLDELVQILCDYYDSSVPERLIGIIAKQFPESVATTGQLLGFFDMLERVLAKDHRVLQEVQEAELLDQFDRYIHREQREVQELIDATKARDCGEGALQFLKFMLGFRKRPVRVEFIEELLAQEGYSDIKSLEQVMRTPPTGLVRKTKNQYWRYEFRDDYTKSNLLLGWPEWRNESTYYHTRVFDLLCDHRIWDAEQALCSQPSRAAVEILYSEGLYYYQYYGHSDAGYALRFLGSEAGGAVDKWVSLCDMRIREGGSLWDLVYWRTKTSLNPYRHYKTSKSAPGWFFAPELLSTAATAYWVIGYAERALWLLESLWPRIDSRLTSEYPDAWPEEWVARCDQRLSRVRAEMDLLLARIVYHRGRDNGWRLAVERCVPYTRGEYPASEQQLAEARMLAASPEHYRRFALGRMLPPLRFRSDDKWVRELLSVSRDESGDQLVRLRALHTVCTAVWDDLLNAQFAARSLLQRGITSEDMDGERLDRGRQTLREAMSLLQQARSRPADRPWDVPPGGRRAEGELFFWEAVFLGHRCLLMTADMGMTVTKYRSTLDAGSSKAKLRVYDELARLCLDLARCGLFSKERQSALVRRVGVFSGHVQGLLDSTGPLGLPTYEAERQLGRLYDAIIDECVDQAIDYFRAADTIYTRLGDRQGRAEVFYQRGLIWYRLGGVLDRRSAYESLRQGNLATDGLGFHRDRLCANVIVARDMEASDVSRAVCAYENSLQWSAEAGLGLPGIIRGELSYRLGVLLVTTPGASGWTERALALMEQAQRCYDSLPAVPSVISEVDAFERSTRIRWCIAELCRRQASVLPPDEPSRAGLLSRAEENCNWIINRTKEDMFKPVEMEARRVKASVSLMTGNAEVAVEQYGSLITYYEGEQDNFGLLETLLGMCTTLALLDESPGAADGTGSDYVRRLVSSAQLYLDRFEGSGAPLSLWEKAALFQACRFLGTMARTPDLALYWLLSAFDLLTSLGLYGNAILLDDYTGPVAQGTRLRESYEERLVQASQRINPTEDVDWRRVGAILRSYFPITVASTPSLEEKRDYLELYDSMVTVDTMQEAIRALELGVELIERDNPEDIDFELLARLRGAYRAEHMHEEVKNLDRLRQELGDIHKSKVFLLLAEQYLDKGWDARWALSVATDVRFQGSVYFGRAQTLLEGLKRAGKRPEY
jgi:hypothetical protein